MPSHLHVCLARLLPSALLSLSVPSLYKIQKSIKSDIRLKQNRDFAIFLVCRALPQVAAGAGGRNQKLFTPR
jgi:hypothetical protein